MPESPAETARRRAAERRAFSGAGATEIARQQTDSLRQGYRRGTEPAPPVRQIGPAPTPLRPDPGAAGLSRGVISSEEKERRRREKMQRGEPLTQEDL